MGAIHAVYESEAAAARVRSLARFYGVTRQALARHLGFELA